MQLRAVGIITLQTRFDGNAWKFMLVNTENRHLLFGQLVFQRQWFEAAMKFQRFGKGFTLILTDLN